MKLKTCPQCGSEIGKDKPRAQRFCNRSCAARYNNRGRTCARKRFCMDCGKYLQHSTKGRCHACYKLLQESRAKARPIGEMVLARGRTGHRFNCIREWAKKLMARSDRAKRCEVCGFAAVVEVAHIRPIADFPETTPMGEVNSLENMVHLCPNHHALLERGLMDLVR